MVPKEHLGRANGMMAFLDSGPGIASPMLAGILLPRIGIEGILLIDLVALAVALMTLGIVHIPQPVRSSEGLEGAGNIWKETITGFRYILKRPSLVGLVIILFFSNLFGGFCNSVQTPLILARTGNDSLALGSVRTAGAISFALGGLLVGIWGGGKRRLDGFLLGWAVYWTIGAVFFGFGRSPAAWIPLSLIAGFLASLGVASGQSLLQVKVAPDLQGRVFAARRLLTWMPDMVTPVLGGLLADRVMEPAMQSNGALTSLFGWMTGSGPGAGMALIMIFFGILTVLATLAGYIIPQVRRIESILPDHDQVNAPES
jgi:hypothetical protein